MDSGVSIVLPDKSYHHHRLIMHPSSLLSMTNTSSPSSQCPTRSVSPNGRSIAHTAVRGPPIRDMTDTQLQVPARACQAMLQEPISLDLNESAHLEARHKTRSRPWAQGFNLPELALDVRFCVLGAVPTQFLLDEVHLLPFFIRGGARSFRARWWLFGCGPLLSL